MSTTVASKVEKNYLSSIKNESTCSFYITFNILQL